MNKKTNIGKRSVLIRIKIVIFLILILSLLFLLPKISHFNNSGPNTDNYTKITSELEYDNYSLFDSNKKRIDFNNPHSFTYQTSVNTKKSIYNVNETADILIAVLDNHGYLVSNANLILNITSPKNISIVFTTQNNEIFEKEKGIYEGNYPFTDLEGNYSILVSLVGNNFNSTVSSYFVVLDYYSFDILRTTPVVIDPWKEQFNSSIKIISFTNASVFNFSEVLPINFTINHDASFTESVFRDKKVLTWTNLNNNSVVHYSAKIPLITPKLYRIGPSFVKYNNKIFYEAKPWVLAVDPVATETADLGSLSGLFGATAGSYTNTQVSDDTRWVLQDDGIGPSLIGNMSLNYDISALTNNAITGLNGTLEYCHQRRTTGNCNPTYRGTPGAMNIWIYNDTGDIWIDIGDISASSSEITITWNVTGTIDDYINGSDWVQLNFEYYFTADDAAFAVDYASLIVDYDIIPNVTNLSFPLNDSIVFQTEIDFNFTATDDTGLANCTLWGNFSGSWQANKTVLNPANNTETNITINIDEGSYLWNVKCFDDGDFASFDFFDYNYSFEVNTEPDISLISPINNSIISSVWNPVNFKYNVTDESNIANCSLIINNIINQTNYTVEKDVEQNFYQSLEAGSYNWSINCTDNSSSFLVGFSDKYNLTIIQNRIPYVTNITVNDPINLNAGVVRTIYCNATINDLDNISDLTSINSTLYHSSVSVNSTDDNNNHYTNNSCKITGSGEFEENYSCSFSMEYYSNIGNWTCNISAYDNSNSTNSSEINTTVNELVALDISSFLLDFGDLEAGNTSQEDVNLTITNLGNIDINITIEGYSETEGDGLAMNCTKNNIMVGYERYSTTFGTAYSGMTNLTSSPSLIVNFTLPQRNNDTTYKNDKNTTYWKIQIPYGVSGPCNGSINFLALPT